MNPDLPVVDPTTGLVDPDEVIVVTDRLKQERDEDEPRRMSWSPEVARASDDESKCHYWVGHTTVESDQTHTMMWYGPKGSPIWIGQCMWCGWVDGQELARRIAELLAAYEELKTAARAWRRHHFGVVVPRATTYCPIADLRLCAAVDALPPEVPVPPLSATESAEQPVAPLTDTEATYG